ncbi:MAG: SDR family oxidoreductase, partial [Xanthomonadales bacterium]|nr:SDR family oxidoreductase [Xanthomonadales bacterium]
IARRVSAGKQVLLADLQEDSAKATAEIMNDAGFEARAAVVDVTSRESVEALVDTARAFGEVTGLIHTAGVSPSSAPPAVIFKVDLYGAAVVLETFGDCIAEGGSGLLVSSQAGHRLDSLTPEQTLTLATTPTDELLDLEMLQPDQVTDSLQAYEIAKRGASLRMAAESVRWAKRGARLNAISPGIVGTPLSRKELSGAHSSGYRRMIEQSAAGRVATPDEIGAVGALLMGPQGAFISGSDLLMDGGVTAAYRYGTLEL